MCLSQEEAIPELEIDVDELLDMENDSDRAACVKVSFHIKPSGLQITTCSAFNYKLYSFDSQFQLDDLHLKVLFFQILYIYMTVFLLLSNRTCW